MKTFAVVAAVAAAAAVAASTKTLPMVVPSTAEELLAMPPIVLERLQQQESARAARTAREIVGGVEVDPPFKYPWYSYAAWRASMSGVGSNILGFSRHAHSLQASRPVLPYLGPLLRWLADQRDVGVGAWRDLSSKALYKCYARLTRVR